MSQASDLAGQVYAALKKAQPLTLQELASLAGASTDQVRLALADLGADGIRVWADSQGRLSISTRAFPDFSAPPPAAAMSPEPAGASADAEPAASSGDGNERQAADAGEPGSFDLPSSQERGEQPRDDNTSATPVPDAPADTPAGSDDTGASTDAATAEAARNIDTDAAEAGSARSEAQNSPQTGAAGAPAAQESVQPMTPDLAALRAQQIRAEAEAQAAEKPMTLMGHLNELRSRLTRCVIAALLGFAVCYGVSDLIFAELMKPLTAALPEGSKLIFTALPEAFFTYMRVAFVAGLFLTSPYIFYQIWAFIAPGLYDEEKRHAVPIAITSAVFFIAGAAFCYFVVFPFAFTFFMGFATDIIQPMPSLGEYLSFSLKLLLAFGLIFEMPLFTFFLSRMGVVTAAMMRSVRRYAILGVFIVAAILTPPDVMSQLLMAGPMLLLYEISILIAATFGRRPKAEAAADSTQEQRNQQENDS